MHMPHTRIEKHLRPLAVATNVTQANNARLDVVLLTLAYIFYIYCDVTYDTVVRDAIHSSLEKRWKKADQEVFILAILFNPYVRKKCFNRENPLFTEASLWGMVTRCYSRMFPESEHGRPNWEMPATSVYGLSLRLGDVLR